VLQTLSRRPDLDRLMDFYQPAPGMARHRETGARWLRRTGLVVPPERVIITSGAQHGAATVLASLTRPGDMVLTEQVTYTGMKAIASLLHLQLRGLPPRRRRADPRGLRGRLPGVSAPGAYCMPTLQNPTGRTMPLERRQALAEIASRYDVGLVEDDVYGFLPEEPLPSLAALAPAHAYYITSTSKSMAPGLRVGYVVAPESRVERVAGVIRASTWLIAPLLAELATEWIERGEADAMVAWKREETLARHAAALRILGSLAARHAVAELPPLAPAARALAHRGVRAPGAGPSGGGESVGGVHGRARRRAPRRSGLSRRNREPIPAGRRAGAAGRSAGKRTGAELDGVLSRKA
jgi:DNA-binding transcriptional MocR family regulator